MQLESIGLKCSEGGGKTKTCFHMSLTIDTDTDRFIFGFSLALRQNKTHLVCAITPNGQLLPLGNPCYNPRHNLHFCQVFHTPLPIR